MDKITVALIGNPNSGKSALFNSLTGSSQPTGNWGGKTVKPFTSSIDYNNICLEFTDLPGVYGFSPTSPEESMVMDYLFRVKPDVVVVVIDALHLERNLYLAIEAIEHFQRLVVVVTKTENFQQHGYTLNTSVLAENLGIPVLTAASTKQVKQELIQQITNVAKQDVSTLCLYVDYPESIRAKLSGSRGNRGKILKKVEAENEEFQVEIIQSRYNTAAKLFLCCTEKNDKVALWQEKLDSYALHPVWGIPLMGFIFGALFFLTFVLCRPLSEYIGIGFDSLGDIVENLFTVWAIPFGIKSLVVDGLIKGIGATVSFTPQLAVFFFMYAFLQDSGYLVRVAFLTDRVMSYFGLNGKTFLPLVVGCTCNVNGILACRMLTGKYDRTVAMLASTYVPCSARVGVIVFLVSAFFDALGSTIVMLSLLVLCVFLMTATAYIVKAFVKPDDTSAFLMEIPHYQKPSLSVMVTSAAKQTLQFLRRIKTVIIYASCIMWFLSSYPSGPFEQTYIAQLGQFLEPLGQIFGLNWQLIVALLFGIAAKETALTALGIMYHAMDDGGSLAQTLISNIDPLSAFIFLTVYMIYLPCAPTIITMKQETGKWQTAILSIINNLFFAVLLAFILYNIGKLFF